jgi:hypothetical protein
MSQKRRKETLFFGVLEEFRSIGLIAIHPSSRRTKGNIVNVSPIVFVVMVVVFILNLS